jgi:FlaA1/EpsC-like NDP-sugar epimerase
VTSQQLSTARRLCVDVLMLSGCFTAALLIYFEGKIPAAIHARLPIVLPVSIGVFLIGLIAGRAYRKMVDYVGLHDFVGLLKWLVLAALALISANALAPHPLGLPWPLLALYVLLATFGKITVLFTRRIWRESGLAVTHRIAAPARRRPVLVYGAGRAGSMVARDIQQSPELGYELVGFIDDDPEKWGKEIYSVRVLGGRHELRHLVGPELREVVLAIPSLDAETRREVLTHCRRAGAQVRTVPSLAELLRDSGVAHQIRDVRVEDLLPRESVELDETEVRELIGSETVLVTGAGGSIGSELCHQILRHAPAQLLLVEQSESRLFYLEMELERKRAGARTEIVSLVADIRDEERIEAILKAYRPALIFHAAAYKHVPMMEKNPQEAILNNVLATYSLATLADQYRVSRFILVSTDKAVEPTSVMGASKRCAELILHEIQQRSDTRFVTVRFGNVLDSDGSVVPLFKQQIAAGGPITITHPDMERFFMTIPEAVRLILQASAMGDGGEVFVLEMGKPVRILDLARSLVELSGLRFMEDIQVTFSGIRPGEKLSEKLFFDHERDVPTKSRLIHRARLANGRNLDVQALLRSLRELLRSTSDPHEIAVRFMTLTREQDAPARSGEDAAPARAVVVALDRIAASGR